MRIFCVSIPAYRCKEPASASSVATANRSKDLKTKRSQTGTLRPRCGQNSFKASRANLADSRGYGPILLRDLGDNPRADGPAAFADREAQTLVHRDRSDQLHAQIHIVARHH